jgi:hypothetical protein
MSSPTVSVMLQTRATHHRNVTPELSTSLFDQPSPSVASGVDSLSKFQKCWLADDRRFAQRISAHCAGARCKQGTTQGDSDGPPGRLALSSLPVAALQGRNVALPARPTAENSNRAERVESHSGVGAGPCSRTRIMHRRRAAARAD